jgi:hypothetical protein
MAELSAFQPGFYGASGEGAGKHAAVPSDNIDATVINRIENAIMQLKSKFDGEGHYGPFRLEDMSGGTITEYFNGNGSTKEFTLSRAILKEQVSGYNIRLSDPYSVGILPIGLDGSLTSFDSESNVSKTLIFNTAPSSGTKNVSIIYYIPRSLGSQLDSGAFLEDWI